MEPESRLFDKPALLRRIKFTYALPTSFTGVINNAEPTKGIGDAKAWCGDTGLDDLFPASIQRKRLNRKTIRS